MPDIYSAFQNFFPKATWKLPDSFSRKRPFTEFVFGCCVCVCVCVLIFSLCSAYIVCVWLLLRVCVCVCVCVFLFFPSAPLTSEAHQAGREGGWVCVCQGGSVCVCERERDRLVCLLVCVVSFSPSARLTAEAQPGASGAQRGRYQVKQLPRCPPRPRRPPARGGRVLMTSRPKGVG